MTPNIFEFSSGVCSCCTISGTLPRLFLVFYAAAFFAELCRIKHDGRVLRAITLGALLLGLIPHSILIFNLPIGAAFQTVTGAGQWFYVLAWGLVLLEAALFFSYPKTPFGAFLLPAVFVAVFAGSALSGTRFREASHLFGALHGISLLAATVFFLYGFITGAMFFLQRAKIKSRKGFLRGIPLPSLEWLRKSNRVVVRLSLFFLGLGIFFGLVIRRMAAADGIPTQGDLMVWGGISLFLLMAIALFWISKSDPSRNDGRTALLCVVSFLILIVILSYGTFASRAHWLFTQSNETAAGAPADPDEESAR
ncbi:MAG: hypothetical protein J6S40_09020 [Thermoguttaceae bacterium]|nr:hypothetical protein [Thermoguttaceae bacterium]